MASKFNFENATFHFTKTDGPGGFLPIFLGAYIALSLILTFINYAAAGALFGSLQDLQIRIATGDISGDIFAPLILYYLITVTVGILFWVMFEGAIQRRYVRNEGFRIKLGGDEGRLFVVGLVWLLFLIAAYFAFAIFVGIFTFIGAMIDPVLGGIMAFLSTLTALGVWIYLAVRLSAASALTVRDRQIRFPSSMKVTKGRFWTLFGAFLILSLIVVAVYVVGFILLFTVIFTGIGIDFSDPQSWAVAFSSFESPVTLFVMSAIGAVFQGITMFAWAGPGALAAKVDPRLGGGPDAASVFE